MENDDPRKRFARKLYNLAQTLSNNKPSEVTNGRRAATSNEIRRHLDQTPVESDFGEADIAEGEASEEDAL